MHFPFDGMTKDAGEGHVACDHRELQGNISLMVRPIHPTSIAPFTLMQSLPLLFSNTSLAAFVSLHSVWAVPETVTTQAEPCDVSNGKSRMRKPRCP